MKCRDTERLSVEFLSGRLDPEKKRAVEAHLESCTACRESVNRLRPVWNSLGGLPVSDPGPGLRGRFDAALTSEKRKSASSGHPAAGRAESVFRPAARRFGRFVPAYGLPLALILLGFIAGFSIRGALTGKGDTVALRSEIAEMRGMLTLSLLNQPASSDRLRGAQVSRQVTDPDASVQEALLNALNSDPSVGVRLAAVDALYLVGDRPSVRAELVRALKRQTSPIVQIQIIDLLVELRERKALDALRFLVRNGSTNPSVRQHAEWGVQQLI
jgi:hypothetical protein